MYLMRDCRNNYHLRNIQLPTLHNHIQTLYLIAVISQTEACSYAHTYTNALGYMMKNNLFFYTCTLSTHPATTDFTIPHPPLFMAYLCGTQKCWPFILISLSLHPLSYYTSTMTGGGCLIYLCLRKINSFRCPLKVWRGTTQQMGHDHCNIRCD